MEIQRPTPKQDEALIRVLRAGVCNTDLEIMKGYMGFTGVLGHEFVGVVVESSSDESLIGKRVCGDINLACADCNVCSLHTDRSRNHCPNRTVLGIMNKDGTMAEFLTLPVRNLHVVPDSVTDEEAVFTEPLAAACRVVEQGLVQQNDKVAVLGDGKLGLMVS
jgi:threonine dehydrogenase-like Zn-dependent dehydrogenase